MTKGTIVFRICISVLLALTMIFVGFFAAVFVFFGKNFIHTDNFGIFVAGVEVTRKNMNDILGDDTVWYTPSSNTLHFENSVIEYDYSIIYSVIDLTVELIGENKFVCKDGESIAAIYAAEHLIAKDLVFVGEGSLSVEYQNVTKEAMAIYAKDLNVEADITITTPSCTDLVNGIVCNSSMIVNNGATVTVNNGAANHSAAIYVRGNLVVHSGTTVNASIAPGAIESSRGLCVDGDLIIRKDGAVNVSVEDEGAEVSECLRAHGVIDADPNATVTATSKKAPAIECLGSIRLRDGVTVTADTAAEGADIFCHGAIVNYGATVNGVAVEFGGANGKGE